MIPVGHFLIQPSHPTLAGHFPGEPVVPGVVLLDRVLTTIGNAQNRRPVGLPVVKFTQPVLPNQAVTVFCAAPQNGRIAFQCVVVDTVVVRGSVALE